MPARSASLVVTIAGSLALASCVLDFDEVGPAAQGGTGNAGASSGGQGGFGGDTTGGGGSGASTVIHDCTNQQAECVTAPGELFVLADSCAAPLFTGGRGHDAGAVDLALISCGCSCDGPCTVTVNRHVLSNCGSNVLGSFQLADGQCTDDLGAVVFSPNQRHTIGATSFDCTPNQSPNATAAFEKPSAACGFESVGCPGDDACLSTSAPVCLEKEAGAACPAGFTKEVEVLKESLVLDSVCECTCEKGADDSCPNEVFAGDTCAATAKLPSCGKAAAIHYTGQGECEPVEDKSTNALVSTKLCCNKTPPP